MSSRETVASLGVKLDALLQSVSELRCENTELKTEISQLKELFENEKKTTRKYEHKITQLEAQISVNQKVVSTLKHAINKSEQYSRRTSLRIYDVPRAVNEKASDCLQTVMNIVKDPEIDINIPVAVIDRAHRVGKGRGSKPPPIIVKFSTFRHRTEVYRARQKISDQFKCVVGLDLTKENVDLLNEAKKLVKEMTTESPIDYIFADINCQLMVKTISGQYLRFDDMDGFSQLLYDLGHNVTPYMASGD